MDVTGDSLSRYHATAHWRFHAGAGAGGAQASPNLQTPNLAVLCGQMILRKTGKFFMPSDVRF